MKMLHRALIAGLILHSGVAIAQVDPLSIMSSISTMATVGKWITQNSKKLYYVEVEGQGSSFEDAKQRAFKIAVEKAVGSLVLNETEVANQDVIRNDVVMYSSGMVEKYVIKNKTSDGSQTHLVMDVWVSDSRIADRLMTIGKANAPIAGDQVVATEKTRRDEQMNGDRVIAIVANDFPKRAFEIKIRNTQIERQGRDSQLIVNARLMWSNYYVNSLIDALQRTRSGEKGYASVISVKPTDGFFVVFAGYNDREKEQILRNRFINSNPMVQVTALGNNSNDILIQDCYTVPEITEEFVTASKYASLHIQGNYSINLRLAIGNKYNSYDEFFTKIEKIKNFDLRVIPENQCRSI
jgi:hypothetical protein